MENKESKSYIERIEIKGLWGRFDVDWKLHSDVNILVGENGTGKSTILKLVESYLKGEKAEIRSKLEFIEILLDNGNSIGLTSHDILPLNWPVTHPIFLLKTFDAPFYIKTERERVRKPYIVSTLDDDLDVVMDKYVDYQLNKSNQLIFQKLSR